MIDWFKVCAICWFSMDVLSATVRAVRGQQFGLYGARLAANQIIGIALILMIGTKF